MVKATLLAAYFSRFVMLLINTFFKMKKLLLSLAALAFATLMFSMQNMKIAKDKVTNDTVAKVEKVFQA